MTKKRLSRKILAVMLAVSLVAGGNAPTAYATETTVESSEEETTASETTETESESGAEKNSENSEDESSENKSSETETAEGESSEAELESSEIESTEQESSEAESETEIAETEISETETETKSSETETTETETESSETGTTETETESSETEATETETETEEETTEDSTALELNSELTNLNATPESDFEWDVNMITKYKGNAENVVIPERARGIDSWAFAYNEKIKSVTITKNITTIKNDAFKGCSSLQKVKFETTILAEQQSCGTEIFKGCDISKVEFPQGMQVIPDYLFKNATFHSGTEITFPESITKIGREAFYQADNLKRIKFTGNKLISIGVGSFRKTSIDSLELPESLKYINSRAFGECKKITNVIIPKNVEYIGMSAFSACSSLSTVNIKTSKIPLKGGCDDSIFYGCQLSKIELPDSWTYIPDDLFNGATFKQGTVIVIPPNVTNIGVAAFNGSNLEKITFSGNKLKSIGKYAFSETCLETISFPQSLEKIEYGAFIRNKYLYEVDLPSNVKELESMCFAVCPVLSKVVFPKSLTSISDNTFWYSNASLKVYAPKGSYAYEWAVKKGYAVAECYSISYNLNGGTNGSGNPTAYEKGESLTFSNPSRKGYTFEGWFADSKCTKPFNYSAGSTTGNLTLYAKWKLVTYSISYELNGGTEVKNPVTYNVNSSITLKSPKKTGYIFNGWFTDAACKGTKLTAIKKGTTGNLTLYAGWRTSIYNIKFAANGSKDSAMSMLKDCYYGTDVTLPANTYTRVGYTFAGWNTKKNGKGTTYADKAKVSNLTTKDKGTVTLYAIWTPINYKINYQLNGGENNVKNPATYTIKNEVSLKNPKKTGYTFKGWYKDAEYTQKITSIKTGTHENITVYAKWQENVYNVSFSKNAKNVKGSASKLTKIKYTQEITLPANPYSARPGYTFTGWNTKPKGNGTHYDAGQKVKGLSAVNNGKVTLYAEWKKN